MTKDIARLSSELEKSYIASSPRSCQMFEQAAEVMPGAAKGAYYHKPYPLSMDRGEGCHVWDVDGRRFVDFVNHHTGQIIGHRNPSVMAAVEEQLTKGIVLGAPVGTEAELAAEICRRVSSVESVRFTNSGTEATLHLVRLARGITGRRKIAKFEGGYHGQHDAVEISVGPPLDQAGPATAPTAVAQSKGIVPRAVEEAIILPYNDPESVERLIEQHRDELACVMFDPKAGIMPQRPEFVQFVRQATADNDILMVFDEIVGFGTGVGGLQTGFGVKPDLTSFGKIIGGGFPVGAFGGRADLMERFDMSKGATGFSQSGTYSGHPVTMAAGLATLTVLDEAAFAHLEGLGVRLCSGLNTLFKDAGFPAQAVHNGPIFSIHFTTEKLLNYRVMSGANKELVMPSYLMLLEQGFNMCYAMGMNGISLPMETEHIDGLVKAMGSVLEKLG